MADNKQQDPLQTTEATEVKTTLKDQLPGMDGALSFIKKYQNILIAAGVAILGIIVFMMMRGGTSGANEMNADKALQPMRQYMQMDSFSTVINGNDSLGVTSLKKYLAKYKGTKAANEARLYGAICYLHLGNPNETIKMLKDVGSLGKQENARKLSLFGDAYSEKGTSASPVNQSDCNEAIDYYRKAADAFSEDEGNAASYLFKAAQLYSQTGKAEKAKELYKEIKDKYPGARLVTESIEKYLGKEGVEN
jgi:tetratricopeptide (TPR) repeat protein